MHIWDFGASVCVLLKLSWKKSKTEDLFLGCHVPFFNGIDQLWILLRVASKAAWCLSVVVRVLPIAALCIRFLSWQQFDFFIEQDAFFCIFTFWLLAMEHRKQSSSHRCTLHMILPCLVTDLLPDGFLWPVLRYLLHLLAHFYGILWWRWHEKS
jgi:hypothetical protein